MRQTLTNANERATQNQPTMRTKQLGSRLSTNRPTPTNDNSAPRLHVHDYTIHRDPTVYGSYGATTLQLDE
nr:MAG: hypothetical protein AmFV_00009 [Apis mellifera filamentous virus]